MFDVSWGETFVLIGISFAAVGRKDLPKASKFLGTQVGRIVGLLQGARARADRFAQTNELHALQNELRSGLRELDTVKGELAVAASSQGLIGRGLGSTISSKRPILNQGVSSPPIPSGAMGTTAPSPPSFGMNTNLTRNTALSGSDYLEAARAAGESSQKIEPSTLDLAPRSQSVAAVAEEEWVKRGIGFKTKAEMGTGFWESPDASTSTASTTIGGGSSLLADLIQQNLIHDQYDRAVMEQDQEIEKRMEKAKVKAQRARKDKNK